MNRIVLRGLVVLFAVLCCMRSDAQKSKTTYRNINRTDASGQKQGYWFHCDSVVVLSVYSGYGSKDGCQYSEFYECRVSAAGNYTDGHKNGDWAYFMGRSISEVTTYRLDTVIRAQDMIYNYDIHYDLLEQSVRGEVCLKNDWIRVSCTGQKCCFATREGQGIRLFERDALDMELIKLSSGLYDREIRIIMNRDTLYVD